MKKNLAEISKELNLQSGWEGLPELIFVTDQAAQPFPENIIENLQQGSMVIFRDYDHENRVELALALRYICKAKNIQFVVAGDLTLALMVDADGLHLPEYMMSEASSIKRDYPELFISVSCHDKTNFEDLPANAINAVLLAPIFPTKSHPETIEAPELTIGPQKLKVICREVALPVYALGGVNDRTAEKLVGTGVAGVAAIRGF